MVAQETVDYWPKSPGAGSIPAGHPFKILGGVPVSGFEPVKGFKDYPPEEQAFREELVSVLAKWFKRYGFQPLETPIVEKWEVLSAKYAGGSEILKEAYRLTDQGGRELGLRYDLTVPLARFVASKPNLKMPFKRYQVGPVFRDGPVKKGRLRQLWQADADIVGSESLEADAECLRLALDVFEDLGLSVVVKLNSRKFLNELVSVAGVEDFEAAVIALDKLEKFGGEVVVQEMVEKGIPKSQAEELLRLALLPSEELKALLPGSKGLSEVDKLLSLVNDSRVVFTPSLARGLAYYTGSIFEVYSSKLDSSIAAGGRYDDLIGLMTGKKFPAVGISFGVEPLSEVLRGSFKASTSAQVMVMPIKQSLEGVRVASYLRRKGLRVDLDVAEKSITKNLDYANSYKVPYALIIGKREVEQRVYTLRDMRSGEEFKLGLDEVFEKLSKEFSLPPR